MIKLQRMINKNTWKDVDTYPKESDIKEVKFIIEQILGKCEFVNLEDDIIKVIPAYTDREYQLVFK